MTSLPVLLALIAFAAPTAEPPSAAPDPLVGVWRGTSTCIRPAAGPACKDEVVVYRFTPGASPGEVRLAAFKIVAGEEQFMGDQELARDAASGLWVGEFSNQRFHGLWRFRVDGAELTGELLLLPERTRVRDVAVHRD